MTNVTRAEWELVETVRMGALADEFRLSIRQQGGEWLIDLSRAPHDDANKMRGTGSSFSEAWAALTVKAVEPITPPHIGGQK